MIRQLNPDQVKKLQSTFYSRDDVVQVGRELLGKVLCTDLAGGVTRLVITETEAYAGEGDRLWIEDHKSVIDDAMNTSGPRVGVDYAGEDALRPYRFIAAATALDSLSSGAQ